MKPPRVILLAAGQGSRLGELTRERPKCLMPIHGEALLMRLVRQLWERGFEEIIVVVGHMRERIVTEFATSGYPVKFVHNPLFATDTNIKSLLLGLESRDDPALVIEADVVFEDGAMDAMAEVATEHRSLWFTRGEFQSWQMGGILRAGPDQQVQEILYVPSYESRFADYKKLLGVLLVGPGEMPRYHQLLRDAAARSMAQYFMMPWIQNLAGLPCRECDLSRWRTASFNTPDEYNRCLELFAPDEQNVYGH